MIELTLAKPGKDGSRDRRLWIDPMLVAAVTEDARRTAEGWKPVAVVRLGDGWSYVVLDPEHNVGGRIAALQQARG